MKWNDNFLYSGYRHKNLFYLSIVKCASTYYNHIFGEILSWEKEQVTAADLKNFTIFAHIRNPQERYISGLVTFISMYKLEEYLKYNESSSRFLYGTIYDLHTAPYTFLVPDILDTEWLLLNHENKENMGNFLLFWFLRHHGIDIDLEYINTLPMRGVTNENPKLKKIYNNIVTLLDCENDNKHIRGKSEQLFYLDQYVYQLVRQNTMYWKKLWPEISWINNWSE